MASNSVAQPDSGSGVRLVHRVRGVALKWLNFVFGSFDATWLLLVLSILTYCTFFSVYGIEKFADFRTGYFDFGQSVQIIWLAAHGDLTTYIIGRPILLVVAGAFVLFPTPYTLLVIQSLFLGIGAVPIYLIAVRRIGSQRYALGFALLYLIAPSLWGINQYEFHDLALSIPFLLFAFYFYDTGRIRLYAVAILGALTCNEFVVAIVLFFGLYLCALALLGNPKLTRWLAVTAVLAAAWAVFLDLSQFLPHYTLATINPNSYTFSGSSNFLNPIVLLSNPIGSILYEWPAKAQYLVYMFAPLVFLPFLGLRRLIPGIPWLGIDVVYTPKLAQGGVGAVYALYSQWSTFLLPFLFLAGVEGFAKVKEATALSGQSKHVLRRVMLTMFLVTIFISITTGGLSPIAPPTQFSVGDYTVPTDFQQGATYHGVWPTPVNNSNALNFFINEVPLQDSVLTQNQIGSKMGERYAPVYVFYQPGYVNVAAQAILIDYNLTGLCSSCLTTIMSSANYTLSLSDPVGGIYLYYLVPADPAASE